MSLRRIILSLAVGLSVSLLASMATAQETPQNADDYYDYGNAPYSNPYPQNTPSFLPFNPVGFRERWQPFGPVDISDYGTGPKAHTGFFFGYERLYWSIGKPPTSTVGDPNAAGYFVESFSPITNQPVLDYETSTINTGMLTAKGSYGNRWETGYMDVNDHGWLVSVIDHVAQTQNFKYLNSTVLFNDPNNVTQGYVLNPYNGILVPVDFIPRYPVSLIYNRVVLNGTEIMHMYPAHSFTTAVTSICSMVRVGSKSTIRSNSPVRAGFTRTPPSGRGCKTISSVHKLAFRYFRQRGRWITAAEGRFTAAANFENFHQNSQFASTASITNTFSSAIGQTAGTGGFLPSNLSPNSSTANNFHTVFAPLVEGRLQATYQVTRAFGLKVGYTFLLVNGMSRAADHTIYNAPAFGLVSAAQRDTLIVNGLSFGVEVNR